MKKKIILWTIVLTIVSCSSSKEEPTDPIVGLWKLKSITTLSQEFINDCKLKDQIEINSEKTFTIIIHNEDNSCAQQSSSGSWVKGSGDKYTFTAAGDTQIFTLVSDNSLTFSFVQNSSTVLYTYKKE
ncbi:lipocalin family protein [Polaribacter uvawellassae]|uniref:lipocalin family protein n=1 Tax=Polaribacter uvawellassae TaxID=3133495 RepID=UPI003219AEEB